MTKKHSTLAVIIDVANEFNEELENKIAVEQGLDTPLYGRGGVLDSLGLVSFVIAVEQTVEDELGVNLTLADEKAMSQRYSPFRTIGTLVDYISTLIDEQEGGESL